jgi:ribosomal protein S18 acetylase RimI-like enzyme
MRCSWRECDDPAGGPSDAELATELYLRARKAAAAAGTIPPLVHSDAEVSAWMTNFVTQKLEMWIAESPDAQALGILVLEDEWIDQLYVAPDFTSRGIGGQLLDLAKRERPDGLRLWTFVSNLGAQRFYERHGFAELERTDGRRNEEGAPDIQYAYLPA